MAVESRKSHYAQSPTEAVLKNVNPKLLAVIFGILGILMFSTKAVFVKLAYRYEVDPVTILLFRMLFALPVYLLVAFGLPGNSSRMTSGNYWQILYLGIVGYYLASFFDFVGLQYITASLERLILFIYPTLVVLISAVAYKKPIKKKYWLAIAITYFGIAIIFLPDVATSSSSDILKGAFFIFLSAFTYALFIAGSGDLIPKIGSDRFTSWVMSVSCVFVIAHYLFLYQFEWPELPLQVYGIGVVLAIFCTVIPSFLISRAINGLGASSFAILGSLGPVSTIVLAILILGEQITWYQLAGAVIVIGGVSTLQQVKAGQLKLKTK